MEDAPLEAWWLKDFLIPARGKRERKGGEEG
jgi:hypothetical protein